MRATSDAVSKPSSAAHRSLPTGPDFALSRGGRLFEVVCCRCFILRWRPCLWFRGDSACKSLYRTDVLESSKKLSSAYTNGVMSFVTCEVRVGPAGLAVGLSTACRRGIASLQLCKPPLPLRWYARTIEQAAASSYNACRIPGNCDLTTNARALWMVVVRLDHERERI
jgi:hypothetical protein